MGEATGQSQLADSSLQMAGEEAKTTLEVPQSMGWRIGGAIAKAIDGLLEGLGLDPANISAKSARKSRARTRARKSGTKGKWLKTGLSALNWLAKTGHWAANVCWHWSLKYAHHACKTLANKIAPLRSGSSQSSRTQNPIKFVAHYAVYGFLLGIFYLVSLGLVGRLFGPLRPWIDSAAKFIFFSLFVRLPLLLLTQALHTPWIALGLGVILMVWIVKTFRPGFWSALFIVVFLVAVWSFRGLWMPYLPAETSISPQSSRDAEKTPIVVSDTTQPTPNSISQRSSSANSPMELAQPNKGSQLVASGQVGDPEKAPMVAKKLSQHQTSNSRVSGLTPNSSLLTPNFTVFVPNSNSSGSSPNFVHPWQPSDEDQASFDAELSALSKPCEMMPFLLDTGANISEDMAPRVLGDLADPDKYTIFVGHDKKTIVSASPNPSGLTLAFQGGLSLGGLSGGLLGDAPKNGLEIYWVDVKAIHCNGISGVTDQNQALYQCSWVLPSPRKPITVRCAGAEDLKRLVSAIEFFIRAANDGHGAPISGLPYLNQGVILGGWNKVEVLWAGSPVAEAFGHATGLSNSTLKLGDHLWSLETNTARQSGRDAMEKGLQTLASGKHILFGVASEDWAKAQREEKNTATGDFDPLRRQMDLVVP